MYKPKIKKALSGGKSFIVFILIITTIAWHDHSPPDETFNTKIEAAFRKQLNELDTALRNFQALCQRKGNQQTLTAGFFLARLKYKEAAVLIDYYYPRERRLFNGPDQLRAEEDYPEKPLPPHGFQVMETLLFSSWNPGNRGPLREEALRLSRMIRSMQAQPNLSLKFSRPTLIDALKASLIRMIAKGVTGFDSPLALYSIPEASATCKGIRVVMKCFEEKGPEWRDALVLLDRCQRYTATHPDFSSFDRLTFIRTLADPLYAAITRTAVKKEWLLSADRRPLNQYATSIFAADLFDVAFFSPNNRFRNTPDRVRLGERLFNDPVLSGIPGRNCASCHQPALAFTDGLPKALSVDGKTSVDRNTPTLFNASLQTRYFYDSRVATLEDQLSVVVHSEAEMKGSMKETVSKLKNDTGYLDYFRKAYPGMNDPITAYTTANAVSCYVRSLVSLNSRFDRFMRNDNAAIGENEKKGFNLFSGKGKCGTCHYLPLFSGLVPPEFSETESEVVGAPALPDTLNASADSDQGKFLFSGAAIHKGAFKTPTLRNIELTAPYMHNGVYTRLEDVLDFYNRGGGNGLNLKLANQTLPGDPLNLTQSEISQIISFLKTLTDTATSKP